MEPGRACPAPAPADDYAADAAAPSRHLDSDVGLWESLSPSPSISFSLFLSLSPSLSLSLAFSLLEV